MISGGKVRLREKKLADARDDYTWETDPELARLDAAPVVTATFSRYQADYADELGNPASTSRRFAIETTDGKHIGNCSYYNINEAHGEAELGIMIGDRNYWDRGYGTDTVTTLVNHIFRGTRLNRIHLKTLHSNQRAQKCFQKCGFIPYGRTIRDGYDFTLMELHRKEWQPRQASA